MIAILLAFLKFLLLFIVFLSLELPFLLTRNDNDEFIPKEAWIL